MLQLGSTNGQLHYHLFDHTEDIFIPSSLSDKGKSLKAPLSLRNSKSKGSFPLNPKKAGLERRPQCYICYFLVLIEVQVRGSKTFSRVRDYGKGIGYILLLG